VSDCGAVGGGPKGAIESLTAGTDLECNPWGGSLYPSLVNSTLAGNVTAAAIAQAAERMLYVRFRLGAFDDPATVPFADKSKVWAPPTLPRGHAVMPHTHPYQPRRLERIRRHPPLPPPRPPPSTVTPQHPTSRVSFCRTFAKSGNPHGQTIANHFLDRRAFTSLARTQT
jgi:beta-glucosidase-like glycosyl hydrolase